MAYQVRAAYQPEPSVLENTLEILPTEYETKEQALAFIKESLQLHELTEDISQASLQVNGKIYIYFEIVTLVV
jgi:hypothetical protein